MDRIQLIKSETALLVTLHRFFGDFGYFFVTHFDVSQTNQHMKRKFDCA